MSNLRRELADGTCYQNKIRLIKNKNATAAVAVAVGAAEAVLEAVGVADRL